jgi:hypothetical protein
MNSPFSLWGLSAEYSQPSNSLEATWDAERIPGKESKAPGGNS